MSDEQQSAPQPTYVEEGIPEPLRSIARSYNISASAISRLTA
jgi:hypothetical protein